MASPRMEEVPSLFGRRVSRTPARVRAVIFDSHRVPATEPKAPSSPCHYPQLAGSVAKSIGMGKEDAALFVAHAVPSVKRHPRAERADSRRWALRARAGFTLGTA